MYDISHLRVKPDLKEIRWEVAESIHLADRRDDWWPLVKTL